MHRVSDISVNCLWTRTDSGYFQSPKGLSPIAACDTEQKWNATAGENITIPFKTAEQEKANRVTVIFLKEETVIAQYCHCAYCGDCDVVKKPGVLLQVEEGTVWLTLLDVSIRNSGTYKAKIFIGNKVFKETGSLLVNGEYMSTC
ncbi:hypothetical protein H4Q32_026694 [Labeo rohita]|uniref:Uncharacterized protein n=1 Tax=Labeo rohita TaxID=84645 RepID=A0ABQ8L7L2_LABRO|nr:hypothetical protein H4Q32_026694 [Labeo rohita]